MTMKILHRPPSVGDTERPVPRWAMRLAYALPLLLLPACLWRLPFALHFEMGQVQDGGGRQVRPMAAVVPAVLGGLILTALSTAIPVGGNRHLTLFGVVDSVAYVNGAWKALATVCVTPVAAWGPITVALAIAYHRRRASAVAVAVTG
ncbi:hypothetical protein ACH4TY_04400 [Streptomyces anulatus]